MPDPRERMSCGIFWAPNSSNTTSTISRMWVPLRVASMGVMASPFIGGENGQSVFSTSLRTDSKIGRFHGIRPSRLRAEDLEKGRREGTVDFFGTAVQLLGGNLPQPLHRPGQRRRGDAL